MKVAFGIPTEGHTPPEAFQSIRNMCFRHGVLQERTKNSTNPVEFFDMTAGRMFTPLAREQLAEKAIGAGADYLFMIDDDMLAPANLFELLWRHNVDIVSPLAFTRNPPHLAVLYDLSEGWDPIMHRAFVDTRWIKSWPRNKLVECDATGFGAVLIKTSVLKKMPQPWFMCSSATGEDVWFCHRAKKEAKAHVFMDTSVEIGHLGAPIIINTKTSEQYQDPAEMEKLYGPYKKHGVFDVCHRDLIEEADKKEQVCAL